MSNIPYEEGLSAFLQAEPTGSCGYASGSDQGRDWLRGWTDSQIAGRLKAEETGIDGEVQP
ncbi:MULTISPECIES: hypothetical protein [unclassified Aureimonas]|uniref:hypothetical protein n=1 Tax=unclassified Aureimonas TaxID=2615206 RepID=UPI0006F76217|nr:MULTISPECIES: hypothetical protein [unclassified Aureimonas]KQT52474.1 hypothetical protein ASG62_14735 [Aureimonas sp. Leaf427]KQT77625.1 hypothetical protein ASG54_11675 [Aureimonas sp. Leaf460]